MVGFGEMDAMWCEGGSGAKCAVVSVGVHGFAYTFFRIWKRLSFRSNLGCM
jgi:hypothetical protein